MSDYNHTKGDMANDTTQIKDMPDKVTYENRIKAALADKTKTNKWLAEPFGNDPATISKWCTNVEQPPMEAYNKIAKLLEVDLNEVVRFE